MEAYRDLLEGAGINVLAAIAPDKQTKGFGRTRLLQQLTLAGGHRRQCAMPRPVRRHETGESPKE